MSNTLPVRITSRKTETGETYEGTVTMCGGRPFKLVRKADNTTNFPTRSAVVGAAKNFAKTYGFADVNFGEQTTAKTKVAAKTTATKKAAKKSSVKSTTTQTVTKPTSTTTASKPTSTTTTKTTNNR